MKPTMQKTTRPKTDACSSHLQAALKTLAKAGYCEPTQTGVREMKLTLPKTLIFGAALLTAALSLCGWMQGEEQKEAIEAVRKALAERIKQTSAIMTAQITFEDASIKKMACKWGDKRAELQFANRMYLDLIARGGALIMQNKHIDSSDTTTVEVRNGTLYFELKDGTNSALKGQPKKLEINWSKDPIEMNLTL